MAIIVSLINGGSYEFGPESDDESVRWKIGNQGQLAIIRQKFDHDGGFWQDDSVIRVFNARHWADLETVE
jgi:hypothetical protein